MALTGPHAQGRLDRLRRPGIYALAVLAVSWSFYLFARHTELARSAHLNWDNGWCNYVYMWMPAFVAIALQQAQYQRPWLKPLLGLVRRWPLTITVLALGFVAGFILLYSLTARLGQELAATGQALQQAVAAAADPEGRAAALAQQDLLILRQKALLAHAYTARAMRIGLGAGAAVFVIGLILAPYRRQLGLRLAPNAWWAVGWLMVPAIMLASLAIATLLPGIEGSEGMEAFYRHLSASYGPDGLQAIRNELTSLGGGMSALGFQAAIGLLYGLGPRMFDALGEEIGWRGYLLKETASLGFWPAAFLVGFIWGLWHAPLILDGQNFPDHPVAGVALTCCMCMLWSPLLAWIRLKGGSVLASTVMHGTINACFLMSLMMLRGGSDLSIGISGLAGITTLALVNLGLWWGQRPDDTLLAPLVAQARGLDLAEASPHMEPA